MTMRPTVSVIVTTYHPDTEWLWTALNSALAQSLDDIEILVLDDDHQDSTREQIAALADPRVEYVLGPRRGPAANHALGFALARAPLLSILNQDDRWGPQLLQALLEAYRSEPTAVVAFADHWVMKADAIDEAASDACSAAWGRAGLAAGVHSPFGDLALCRGAIPLAQAAIFRREAVAGRLPPWAGRWYDRYLLSLLVETGGSAVYVPERLAYWREHREQLTANESLRASIAHFRLHCRMGWQARALGIGHCAPKNVLWSFRGLARATLKPRSWLK